MIEARYKIGGLPVKVWLCLFLAVALVRAPFLFYFGYSIDAYSNAGGVPSFDFLAGQGRHGSYLLFIVLQGLGLYGPIPQYAAVLFSIPLLCIAAVLLWSTVFEPQQRSMSGIVFGAVIFLAHPYNAEILTFRDAVPVFAVSTALGVLGYYLGVVRGKVIVSILLMALALSIYQTFINILAIVWLLGAMLSRISPQRLEGVLRDDLRKNEIKGALLIVMALLVYLVSIKLLNFALHIPQNARATFISIADVPARWNAVVPVIKQFLAGDLVVKAGLASILTLLLWATGFAICMRDGRRRIKFVVVPIVCVLTCFASIGVILVGRDFWPMPRVLVSFALLPAFGALYALIYLQERERKFLYVLLCLLLISYTAIGAQVAADQLRVNKRDMLMASAIAARVSLAPGQHVAIVGGSGATLGLGTLRGDMNLSAYWASWSKATALSEFYGYPIQGASDEENSRAIVYCKNASVWPAIDSIHTFEDSLVAVCLSRPTE